MTLGKLTDAEVDTIKRAAAIFRDLGIATVDWDDEVDHGGTGSWCVSNVARMGVCAHTLEEAVRRFAASGFGDPP